MGVDGTSTTQSVARRYFDAWTSRDTAVVAESLAEDFSFTSAVMTIDGRGAFLDAGAFPVGATTEMVAEAYQGDVAFQMYDARLGDKTVRVVEQLTVRNGVIVSSKFVTDMQSFMAFVSG